MNILYNILDANEFSKIKSCKSTKEIWDKLRDIHERSAYIKEHKKVLLVTKYKSLRVESQQNTDKMYCRFNNVIKDLEAHGKQY